MREGERGEIERDNGNEREREREREKWIGEILSGSFPIS